MNGIRPKFSERQIAHALDSFEESVKKKFIEVLEYIGEEFIERARKQGEYTDRTGNLRSSIGYMVVKNGEVVSEGFKGTGEGMQKGKEVASEQASNDGYVLICVAGMEYAAAVESKGYDVITGTAKQESKELKKLLQEIVSEHEK